MAFYECNLIIVYKLDYFKMSSKKITSSKDQCCEHFMSVNYSSRKITCRLYDVMIFLQKGYFKWQLIIHNIIQGQML